MLYLQSRYRLDMQEEQHLEIICTGNISRNNSAMLAAKHFEVRKPYSLFRTLETELLCL